MASRKRKLALDSDGMQPHLHGRYPPQDLLAKLRNKPGFWRDRFDPVIDPDNGMCMFECKGCKQLISVANPSGSCNPHLKACKGPSGGVLELDEDGAILIPEDDDCQTLARSGGGSGGGSSAAGSMRAYTASAAQCSKAVKNILLFAIHSETPLHRLRDPFMLKAFSAFGCQLPSLETLRTKGVQEAFEEVSRLVDSKLESLLDGPGIQLCSDGWKKKAAMQASPLMNFIALHPGGGCTYLHCVDTSGQSKTSSFLFDTIEKEAQEVRQWCL
jgi:hypothetical protein